MKTINIKTYHVNTNTNAHHFYILSKGNNAGKPLENPCPNCFVITAESEQQKYQLFWICYSLWKAGTYPPLLRGSVIPFLHISDVAAEIEKAIQKVNNNPELFKDATAKLKQLAHTEKLLECQLKLISQMKTVAARKLLF